MHSEQIESRGLERKRIRLSQWTLLVGGVVLVALGFFAGYGFGHQQALGKFRTAFSSLDQMPNRVRERLTDQLDLTEEQSERVQNVLETHFVALLKIRERFLPELRDEFEVLQGEIEKLLTDQQRDAWRRESDRIKKVFLVPAPEHSGKAGGVES